MNFLNLDLNDANFPRTRTSMQTETISETTCSVLKPIRNDYSTLELKCARSQRWQAQILELLNVCICCVNNGDWRQNLAAAQGKQLQLYGESSHDKVKFWDN